MSDYKSSPPTLHQGFNALAIGRDRGQDSEPFQKPNLHAANLGLSLSRWQASFGGSPSCARWQPVSSNNRPRRQDAASELEETRSIEIMMKTVLFRVHLLTTVIVAALGGPAYGTTPVPIPNSSFELPKTEFVDTRIEAWQKSPKPDWYQETEEFKWDQLCGVFINPAATNSSYIDNIDGQQALYLFAVPHVVGSQD